MLKKLLRDNALINPIIRTIIRGLNNRFGVFKSLVNQYRIYGNVILDVEEVKFKIYSESDDFIANELYYNLGYELNEFKLIKSLVKSSKYLIDVGSNTGIFSIFAAKINASLVIICFEPHPSNFERLSRNIAANSLTNTTPFPWAIGSRITQIEFTVPANLSISATASVNAGFTNNFHQIDHKQILVDQTTLDDTLRNIPLTSCDIIKIDVEYYELEVLKGAAFILQHKRPLVIIEILQYEHLIHQFPDMKNKVNEHHGNEIFAMLVGFGYYGYSIEQNGLNFIESVEGQMNRNFLFVPEKLAKSNYSFNEILTALSR